MVENWLKDYGFTALQLPRRDLMPGDVLYRGNGTFDTKVGTLSMIFGSAGPLDVSAGEPVASLTRSVSKKVDAGIGLRILGALFGGAASSKLGADTSLKHAQSLVVTYENVTQDSLPVLALQAWLERADVSTAGQTMVWLNQGRMAAVTAVLRTADLSLVAERENGASIALSVPEIQGVVSGNANVSAASDSTSKVTFSGPEAIAFGFQAFKLMFDGNVSFGIQQIRGLGPRDLAAHAWAPDDALAAVADGFPPAD